MNKEHHPTYLKYKPSGVEWLGNVPTHWAVKRLKYQVYRTDVKVEADNENPTPYIGLENIESWTGRLLPSDSDVVPSGISNRFKSGDTLFGKLRPYLAKACNVDFDGLCSAELLVLQPAVQDRRFLLYRLLAEGFISLVDSSSYGVKMPRAGWEFIGSCRLPEPPLEEQSAIADYLDRETAKIDALVAKKRKLIERLKEKRTALISRTVTRGLPPDAARAAGLDPSPKLKPSSVKWLGNVPEHWGVMQVFRIALAIQTGPFGTQLHASDYVDDGIPLINPAHIVAGRLVPEQTSCVDETTAVRLSRHQLRGGDIIMGRRGEIGRCAVVGSSEEGWLCGTGSLVIRLSDSDSRYFFRVFGDSGFTKWLELHAVGSTMLNLNPTIVGRMQVPVPPLVEQTAIADYLDRETAKLVALEEKVQSAIDRLQEYRTALITAAVTGKIDVRKDAA